MIDKPLFSINRYDQDGDIYDEGVYIHFGECCVKVCDTEYDFHLFVNHIASIAKEINDNYCTLK